MKKKWAAFLVIVAILITLCFTKLYYDGKSSIEMDTFIGTYEIDGERYGQEADAGSKVYLAITNLIDTNEGEFFITNSQNDVVQKGKCIFEGRYLTLVNDNQEYQLFYVQDKYYLIRPDIRPEVVEKVADTSVE